MRSLMRVGGLACVLLTASAMAGAEVTDCTEITGLPFDVKEPGIYCLKTNLSVSLPFGGVALTIHADDVVIDLNGHTMEASGPTSAVAVFADAQKDVTVRNGTIRGFGGAVDLGGFTSAAQGNIVEDVRAEGSSAIAIKVAGAGSVVRHNVVVRTGGSSGGSIGILGLGSGVHILDNEVAETVEAPGAQALAINVANAPGAVVQGNVIANAALGPSDSVGIFVSPTCPNASVVGNHVANLRKGLYLLSSVLYRDNTVGGAITAFTGGIAAGSTNFSF